jgi:hypothetical protein
MRCRHFFVQYLVCLAASVLFFGCSGGESDAPPPKSNTHIRTPKGQPIAHLKPSGDYVEATHDPVVWVVDGGKVERIDDQMILIHAYRLDFDETQELTEANLPYALMTEKTKQIVVHRGKPPDVLTHPDINDGERCLPIYQCHDSQTCPRVKELNHLALFPYDGSEDHPQCPHCQGTQTQPYFIPQHNDIKRFMERSK